MLLRTIGVYIVKSDNPFLRTLRRIITKNRIAQKLGSRIVWRENLSDEEYIRQKYREKFGVDPNLDAPKNFNEKNNWRKLHDRKDIYTSMVDKYEIKQIISERVGAEHTFRLLGVWDTPESIDYDRLPDQFVLKPNHSGGVFVCRDKNRFDKARANQDLRRALIKDYYPISREWPYKNVKRRIIAETYMGEDLIDYKNYCFNGNLQYTFVWKNHSRIDGRKPEAHFCGAYNREWHNSGIEIDYPCDDVIVDKPSCYDEMVEISEKMAKDIPFVRVDCYIIKNTVYVGEMTFFPWGGFMKFKNDFWNNFLGELIKLPGIDY